MYSEFFGLRTLPFEDRADTQFYFATPETEETLASLKYELHFGSGLGFITGDTGTGKTTLIRTLLTRLDPTDQVTVLTWPSGGRTDLVREACKGFGVTLPSSHNQVRRLNRLRRHLTRIAGLQQRSILIVDQAENLSAENLTQIASLIDLEGPNGRLLRAVLSAQPPFRSLLDQPQFARIQQQLFGERRLEPYSAAATRNYVEHRLRVAGCADRRLFDDAAFERIHEIALGVPRLINRVCNASLLAAYGVGVATVTAAMVSDAAGLPALRERSTTLEELGLQPVTGPTPPWDVRPAAFETERPSQIESLTISREIPAYAGAAQASYAESNPIAPSEDSGPTYVSDRLERAIDKAERLTATTEASLAQITAVERHLSTLVDRAERLAQSIEPTVAQGTASAEQARRTLTEVVRQADQRAAGITTQSTRAAEWTDRIDQVLARLERSANSAAALETRLGSTAVDLADKAEEVQARITRLMSGIEQESNVRATIEESIERGMKFESDLQRRCDDIRIAVEQSAENVNPRIQTELDRLRTAFLAEFQGQEEKLESLKRTCGQTLRDAVQSIEQTGGDVRNRAQTELDAILKHAATARRDMEDRVTTLTQKLNETLADARAFEARGFQASIENARREWKDLVDQGTRQLAGLEGRFETVTQSSRTIDAALSEATAQSTLLNEQAARAGAVIAEHSRKIQGLEQRAALLPCGEILDRAESAIQEIRSAEKRVESVVARVADALAEVERGADRAAAARGQVAEIEGVIARTRLDRSAAQETIQSLRSATEVAVRTAESITALTRNADVLRTDLTEKSGQARAAADDVRNALWSASTAIDHASNAAAAAQEESRSAAAQCEKLSALQVCSESIQADLTALDAGVVQRTESLQQLIAITDQKIERWGSHHAAASSILDRLAGGTSTGHLLVERLTKLEREVTVDVQDFEARLTESLREAGDVLARTDSLSGDWKQRCAAAVELQRTIERATEGAAAAQTALSDSTVQASRILEELAPIADRAEQAVRKADDVAAALASADGVSTSIAESSRRAGEISKELTALSGEVAPRLSALCDALAQSAEYTQSLDQARERAENVTRGLTDMLSTHAERLARAEEVSDQSMNRVLQMREELNEVGHRLESFTRELDAAMNAPEAVVESVRTHTQHLEQVYAAVRKVFASLSQATLEARRQTQEIRGAGEETTKRWNQLAGETLRAGRTLHQWVEEAVRAQSRLERTLSDAPSIHQTHPADAVRNVADVLDRISGEFETSADDEVNADFGEGSSDYEPAAPQLSARADRIAELIAEAKRAEPQPV